MLGRRGKVVARAAVVAAAAACVSATGLAAAGIAQAVSQQTLVGAWLGPKFGDTGECGTASGEYAFSPDGTYRYKSSSDSCDTIMIEGHYDLQSDGGVLQISMEECNDPGCPPGPWVLSTSISAIDPDSIVLDGHYTYRREHG
jgi:hypothetical protein